MLPPDPRNDAELIAALNAGDSAAFDALYHRYRDRVGRLAHRFTGNEPDALDVVQEAFAYLYRKFPGFRLSSAMMTFLYPVVKHLSLAARRKSRRMTGGEAALASIPAAGATVDPEAARVELAAALDVLPDTHREVLLLRFVDGFSLEEISQSVGIPLGTVKSRMHNAIAALRADPRVREYFRPE